MVDFSECFYKMDKWAAEDFEVQNQFYEIVENDDLSFEEKVSEMADFIDILVWDWERLSSYVDGEFSETELVEALVKQYA